MERHSQSWRLGPSRSKLTCNKRQNIASQQGKHLYKTMGKWPRNYWKKKRRGYCTTDTKIRKEFIGTNFGAHLLRPRVLPRVSYPCRRQKYIRWHRQCAYNLTSRSLRVTILGVEIAKTIAYSLCVSIALTTRHAKSSVTCLALQYFSTSSHKWHDFREKVHHHHHHHFIHVAATNVPLYLVPPPKKKGCIFIYTLPKCYVWKADDSSACQTTTRFVQNSKFHWTLPIQTNFVQQHTLFVSIPN